MRKNYIKWLAKQIHDESTPATDRLLAARELVGVIGKYGLGGRCVFKGRIDWFADAVPEPFTQELIQAYYDERTRTPPLWLKLFKRPNASSKGVLR